MTPLLSILYIIGLYSAFTAGSLYLRARSASPTKSGLPRTALVLLLAIAIPSLLQFFIPGLLPALQRDYERVRLGEWWRLISALFVQDGGLSGTLFNLVGLALLGPLAERLWNGRRMLLIFFLGGLVGEIVGLAWQPVGAGNSVGNFSLAASIAVAALFHRPPRPVQFLALLALAADGILLGLRDIHGTAALAGALITLLLLRIAPPEPHGSP